MSTSHAVPETVEEVEALIAGEETEASVSDTEQETTMEQSSFKEKLFLAGGLSAVAILATGCPPVVPKTAVDSYPDTEPPALTALQRRLIARMTFGQNAREADLLASLGYSAYVEYHLDHLNIADPDLNGALSSFNTLNFTAKQYADFIYNGNYLPVQEFYGATFFRSAYSRRQLFERMVEFWTNHFSIYIKKDAEYFLKPVDDRVVIRPNALGNFPDLLMASAKSPAMLYYLDNITNVKQAPNQNYARELLELHTLGADNLYTQQDIEEVSRCFTGWSLNGNSNTPAAGTFYFNPNTHDNDAKQFLGYDIPAGGGIRDAEIVLEILSMDSVIAPYTAQFIAGKMAVQFFGYDPPQAYIDSIAQAYLNTGGDIKAMVRAALAQSWIAQATDKLKRPYHFAISSLRARPSSIVNMNNFSYIIDTMGNHPYYWAPPNGYPDEPEFWGGFLLSRWNIASYVPLADQTVFYNVAKFTDAATDEDFLDLVDSHYFAGIMTTDTRNALTAYLALAPNNFWQRKYALGLAISAAEYQWY